MACPGRNFHTPSEQLPMLSQSRQETILRGMVMPELSTMEAEGCMKIALRTGCSNLFG
jgi:hypothetical protein